MSGMLLLLFIAKDSGIVLSFLSSLFATCVFCFLQGARLNYALVHHTAVFVVVSQGFLESTLPASRTQVTNSSSEPSSHRSSLPQPSRSSTSSRLP